MSENDMDKKFPGNSYSKIKPKKPDDSKVEKVASARIVQKKKTLGEKFSENFLATDLQSITRYVIFDVLIPEFKNMLSDIVHKSTNMVLFGDRRGARTDRDRGQSYVRTSYSSYFDDRNGRRDDRDDRTVPRPRSRNLVDDLVFDTRADAEEVLSNMIMLIEKYGCATVKNLYNFSDVPSDYTHDKYGWFDLRDATVDRVQGGYLLKLPKPQVID